MEKSDKKKIKDAIVKSIARCLVNVAQVAWMALWLTLSYNAIKRGDTSFFDFCLYIYTAMEVITTARLYNTEPKP